MNGDQPVVIAGGNLEGRIRAVLDLSARVAQHLIEAYRDLKPGHSDVLIRPPRLARPLPGLIEHALVHRVNKACIKRIPSPTAEYPLCRLKDVCLLKFVELALQRDMRRDEPSRLIGINGRGAWRVLELHCHSREGLPSRSFRRRSAISRSMRSAPVG